ncbi:hypothetical protein ZOSMA_100G00130 [Zostera marina]|uniref:HMA domain-containing protein n=1 Tax=Zostera marina TaxID=29655 RepID=A0A0K9Q6H7_ZOSMR|nr:hypothetical protein ZOSMA_100G00130 [Zostera marina]
MKQKTVIKVRVHCDKCLAKVMRVASKKGVESIAMEGDAIVVVGEDIDIACLMKRLQSKVGYAKILTVEEIDEKKMKEKEEDEEKMEEKEEDEEKMKEKEEDEEKMKEEEEKAKETAEREKRELEYYRKSKNPCYITPYVTNCHCKDDYQYPLGPQYPCYHSSRMMCIVDDAYHNDPCTIM